LSSNVEVPKPFKCFLCKLFAVKMNRIVDKQDPCLTLRPLFIILVCRWSSLNLTFSSMHNLPINLLQHNSILIPFRIYINLAHFKRSNAFRQSMKQEQNSSSMSNVRSDIFLSIPVASLAPFPLLNLN